MSSANGSGEYEATDNKDTEPPDTPRASEIPPPPPPNTRGYDRIAQERLTERLLENTTDPYARLVIMMSQRQLDMHEMFVELRSDVKLIKEHLGLT